MKTLTEELRERKGEGGEKGGGGALTLDVESDDSFVSACSPKQIPAGFASVYATLGSSGVGNHVLNSGHLFLCVDCIGSCLAAKESAAHFPLQFRGRYSHTLACQFNWVGLIHILPWILHRTCDLRHYWKTVRSKVVILDEVSTKEIEDNKINILPSLMFNTLSQNNLSLWAQLGQFA